MLLGLPTKPNSMAMSLLSDAQELMGYDLHQANRRINLAKWVIMTYPDNTVYINSNEVEAEFFEKFPQWAK